MVNDLPTIAVLGLWHLGAVTAACTASAGFETVGCDLDPTVVANLKLASAPLFEPGLDDLLQKGIVSNKLSFADSFEALCDSDIVWVCFDTPVDEDDNADVEFVFSNIMSASKHMKSGSIILISSQIPLGTSQKLRTELARDDISIAVSPENLRLGSAIDAFTNPGRIIVGVENKVCEKKLEPLMSQLCDHIIWMTVPSAEMTKHAINGFLAMSVAYTNELATLSERFGANAYEVEKALKSESRIGPKAYVRPGEAFAGGTLARDLNYIVDLGKKVGFEPQVATAILQSNHNHRFWAYNSITHLASTRSFNVSKMQIALLGVAYKPGTSTIRRSNAINVASKLADDGFTIKAHDPEVKSLENYSSERLTLVESLEEAIGRAQIILVMTPWQEYKSLTADFVFSAAGKTGSPDNSKLLLIDQQRIVSQFEDDERFEYCSFGRG